MLDERSSQYRREHPKDQVEICIVLAYCQPQTLSARIHRREIEAEQKNNPKDSRKGLGIYPFHQLAQLVNASREEEKWVPRPVHSKWQQIFGELSREDIFEITREHTPQVTDENFCTDPLVLEPICSDHYKVAPESVVKEYHKLSSNFGFRERDTQIRLAVKMDVKYDLILHTDKKDAKTLADELVKEIDGARSTANHNLRLI